MWGLDVVIGYQVSWLLMFADYSRYTRSGRAAATAVFAGLAMPALWLMPVGWSLARIAGSDDPGTMLAAAGVGWWTAVLDHAGVGDHELRQHLPVVAGMANAVAAIDGRGIGVDDRARSARRSA